MNDKEIAEAIYEAQDKKAAAENRLLDLLFGEKHEGADFQEFYFDPYDGSLEFKGAPPEMRLSPEQLQTLWDSGFQRAWVCHTDDMETHYWEGGPPEGNRRKSHRALVGAKK